MGFGETPLHKSAQRGEAPNARASKQRGFLPTAIIGNQAGRHPGERREGDMAKTASISMEIDSGIKERAMAILEARGMSLSGAVRRMVTLGILEHRIPFKVTRDPVFAGAGMSDGLAKRCGIDKEAPARTGVPTGMVVKMEPEFKREMRRYCSDMCVTPNGLVHMFMGQVAFELRVPFDD